MKKETYVLDSYGEVKIHGYKWLPESAPKAVVFIAHGMAETIERYDPFAAFLCDSGYAVYGHSHRGHGKTAGSLENLGILGDMGWMKTKEDIRRAVEMAKTEVPDVPCYVLGHSMGSFLVRDFLLDYSSLVDGVVLSGTGFKPKALLLVGQLASGVVMKVKGRRYRSKLIDSLSFFGYNSRFKPVRTQHDWLSRDTEQVDAYVADPYCGEIHSVGFFHDFSENLLRIKYAPVFEHKNEGLRIFVLSGDEDPVGDRGKGVRKTADYYKSEGFDTQLKLYPGGRHEMLNEINKDEVYRDILNFFESLQ